MAKEHTWGHQHQQRKDTHLGMQLDYSEGGKCKILMLLYTKEIINSFPEKIVGTLMMSIADHLFKVIVDNKAKKLPEEHASPFHMTTTQLLLLSGRACRDIQTAMGFLTTWVKSMKMTEENLREF